MSSSNSDSKIFDKYKHKKGKVTLTDEEFYRDLEEGEYPDPVINPNKILRSLTGQ